MKHEGIKETERLSVLRSYEVLDSDTESAFDRVAETAARIFEAPMAFISLVEDERQWFKACFGSDDRETPRSMSFCSHSLVSDEVLVVPDARLDPRFSDNPQVTGPPFIRFYAGAPLVTPSGHRLGALCVVDHEARPGLDPAQQRILSELAALVVDLLEMRRAALETRRSESRLDEENRLLAAAVASSVDAILTQDRVGVVTSWNPAAEALYGYGAGEILGRPITVLLPPGSEDAEITVIERVVTGHKVEHYETQRVTKDGRIIDVALSVSPIRDKNGVIVGASEVARDIRTAKEMQEALRAGRELAVQANRAKSEFLSRMSHELRTPLNAILGFAQLLELDDLSVDQEENVREILTGGKHLLQLINEILDISRIETGRLALSMEPVPVCHVIADAMALVAPMAAQRRLVLEVGSVDETLHVMADQQRLRQVIINLLSNGIKYNVELGRVTICCEPAIEGRVRISVADTGLGLSPEKLELLFEPFDRLGAERSSVEGTGLGLAITKRLTEAMGGSLDVRSVVGEGSTFCIELDQAPPLHGRAPGSGPEEGEVAAGAPLTVLYVEDNVSNLLLVQRILGRKRNVRMVSTPLGREAVDLAARELPDVVLLDLNLPDISGDEVLALLSCDAVTAMIPVVVLSADATRDHIRRLLEAGATAYLNKPFDLSEFETVVDGVVARRSQARLIKEKAS